MTTKGSTNDPGFGSPLVRMSLVFKDLVYTVKVKDPQTKKMVDKTILKQLTGAVEPARLTACMGASGAGKTTFLNILAGFTEGTGSVSGQILVNGKPASGDKMRSFSAFVHQEDIVLDTMTVREALVFTARLRIPKTVSDEAKIQYAMSIADELNLSGALDSLVGSSMIKGISGGEKRRLSIAMELITNPAILYLDEPTSGLDTYNAHNVMTQLWDLAHVQQRTVVCTIHQPSSDIFHMFDDLIVLAAGKVMFHGISAELVPYLASQGFSCPRFTNPADYLFMNVLNAPDPQILALASHKMKGTSAVPAVAGNDDVLAHVRGDQNRTGSGSASGSGNSRSMKAGAGLEGGAVAVAATSQVSPPLPNGIEDGSPVVATDPQVQGLLEAWAVSEKKGAMDGRVNQLAAGDSEDANQPAFTRYVAPFVDQFALLTRRAWNNTKRNKLVLQTRFAAGIILALMVGLIYLRIDNTYKNVQNRQGSLFFICVMHFFLSAIGLLTAFGTEKAVFKREYGGRMYGVPAFFWSRWMLELPGRILISLLSSVIIYFMIGYQLTVAKFWIFALAVVLLDQSGASLGMFASCIFADIAVAMAILPMFLMPLLVFSGLLVNMNTMPRYLFWIAYISPMKYGYTALIINEFSDLPIICQPSDGCPAGYNGNVVISNLGFDNTPSIAMNLGILFLLNGFLVFMAYIMLWLQVKRSRS